MTSVKTEPEFYRWKEEASAEFAALIEGKSSEEQFAAIQDWEARILDQRAARLAAAAHIEPVNDKSPAR